MPLFLRSGQPLARYQLIERASLVMAVVVAGGYVIAWSLAAGIGLAQEAEQAKLSGLATVVVQAAASGGQMVVFNAGVPAPTAPVPTPTPTPAPVVGGVMSGLHISGSGLLNGANHQVQMHGVNYSGFEYACLDGAMNDGPIPPGKAQVDGMKSWNINSVRIPLNEDCWLGLHGINAAVSGAVYQQAVVNFVDLLVANNISVIINLHFSGDGVHKAVEQEPMANRAHSNDFWTSVAARFKQNSSVMFELYNEPHLNDVTVTGGTAWGCWRNGGCSVKGSNPGDGSFVVAGMQEMLNAVRAAGAPNIVIVTGEDWGADLSGWVQNRPTDSQNKLVAGWHTYGDGLSCGSSTCWDTTLASVLSAAPILTTEIGQLSPQPSCAHGYIDTVMNWLDGHNLQGYYAWTWGAFNCAKDPALISDTNWTGTPTQTYGSGYKAHLLTRP